MRQILISIFLITYSSFALADFSLTCENFQGNQFELGDKLSADTNIATDIYNTKFVFKNGYLYKRYPVSSDNNLERIAKLVVKGFHNLESGQKFYKFRDSGYTLVFHKNCYNWNAYTTRGGNN